MEHWKPIPGYEGFYEASTLGRIRRIACTRHVCTEKRNFIRSYKEKLLRPAKRRKQLTCSLTNYYTVTLCDIDNNHKTFGVHQLIAKTFLPNPENKPQVNHKNGNGLDNRLVNLEWANGSENQSHAVVALGRHCRRIKCIETGKEFNSGKDAAIYYNIYKHGPGRSALTGAPVHGFHFAYIGERKKNLG